MKNNPLSWYDHKIVVNRRIWRCGQSGKWHHGELQTQMLDSDGMMCCLGQDAEACGIPKNLLLGKMNPDKIALLFPDQMEKIKHLIQIDSDGMYSGYHSIFANDMMTINDDPYMSDSRRELELFLVGKKHRVFIQFVGEYSKNPNCTATTE